MNNVSYILFNWGERTKMKILIGFLLALFISSQVHAQSHAQILEKGKIIQQIDNKYGLSEYVVVHKGWAYFCTASITQVMCSQIENSNGSVNRPK